MYAAVAFNCLVRSSIFEQNAMLTTSVESLRSELGNSQRVASASTSKHIEVMETAMKEVTRLGQENDGLQASVAVFQRR